jgi:hypothetical protein
MGEGQKWQVEALEDDEREALIGAAQSVPDESYGAQPAEKPAIVRALEKLEGATPTV